MPVDFFEKEVTRAQNKFNQTFGRLTTNNISLRQKAILMICGLSCLGKKIRCAGDTSKARDDRRNFMQKRDGLNSIFNTVENFQKERRDLDDDKNTSKQKGNFLR